MTNDNSDIEYEWNMETEMANDNSDIEDEWNTEKNHSTPHDLFHIPCGCLMQDLQVAVVRVAQAKVILETHSNIKSSTNMTQGAERD